MTLIDSPQTPRKRALAPDLSTLEERAVRAWTEHMAVRSLGGSRYAVDSQSGATYVVDIEDGTCTCPDDRIRGQRCKHVRRVAIEITAHRVPPPDHTWAACDGCETATFVPVDAAEPHRCAACALAPGAVVLDRETGERLVVERVTNERAEEYVMPSVQQSVAAYPTNEGYPADDLVVEVTYLQDHNRRREPRVYAFPRSRLDRTDDATILA